MPNPAIKAPCFWLVFCREVFLLHTRLFKCKKWQGWEFALSPFTLLLLSLLKRVAGANRSCRSFLKERKSMELKSEDSLFLRVICLFKECVVGGLSITVKLITDKLITKIYKLITDKLITYKQLLFHNSKLII